MRPWSARTSSTPSRRSTISPSGVVADPAVGLLLRGGNLAGDPFAVFGREAHGGRLVLARGCAFVKESTRNTSRCHATCYVAMPPGAPPHRPNLHGQLFEPRYPVEHFRHPHTPLIPSPVCNPGTATRGGIGFLLPCVRLRSGIYAQTDARIGNADAQVNRNLGVAWAVSVSRSSSSDAAHSTR